MQTDWSLASAVHPHQTAISKAAKALVAAPISSPLQWPQQRQCMGILSIFGALLKATPTTFEGLTMKTLISILIVGFCFAISGCNTVKGVGQDIQKAGEKIEDAAKKK